MRGAAILEANRFFMVRLLCLQTYKQRDPSNFRSKSMVVPLGDLDGLMGLLAFNQLDSVIIDAKISL